MSAATPPPPEEGTTATLEVPAPAPAPAAPTTPAPDACPRCGTPLRPDQEWCLNCGAAARTRVAAPSGWRTPVAIVGAVLAVALAGLVLAFLAISDDSDELTRRAAVATPTPTPVPGQPAAPPGTPTPAPSPTATPTEPVPTITPAPGEPGADPDAPIPPANENEQPPTDTEPEDPGTTGGGTVGSWPDGEDAFTVVLLSSPTRAAARRRAEQLASGGTEVGILDSDEFSSLRGGYHVVFSGQYESRDEAESAAEGLQSDAPGAYVRRVTPR